MEIGPPPQAQSRPDYSTISFIEMAWRQAGTLRQAGVDLGLPDNEVVGLHSSYNEVTIGNYFVSLRKDQQEKLRPIIDAISS